MPVVNIDGNYTQSVDSFLYLGSLYSHLMVIVGQRLCATLGSHHHHHHYISTVSVQRRPCVRYTISAITKKMSRMMSSLHRIWKDKRLSSSTNQITSLPSTGHISRSLGGRDLDSPGHQQVIEMPMTHPPHPMVPGCHQFVFCHSPVFLLGMGRKAGPDGVPTFTEKICIINVPNASVQF